ncbi:putative signal peptide protein [Lysobacter capsici AZ78]|uniref:Signal peptide protein n=1 Tax=Lysobacter capsici AZ78 TaxID=1444315 RepID=A0A120AH39_9GAMM|nr:alpha/beta hydrolase [Lysobacter capsici]KWS05573.1 putative signal peptide protein [Lysobacter capsici AZ78]
MIRTFFRKNLLFGAVLLAVAVPSAQAAGRIDAASARPTVVLVHGAFADASSWNPVIAVLRKWHVAAVAVDAPLTSLADDVAATERAIAAAPGKVVLVGHSWGGTVITQAGDDDKVSALVYVAAFAPDVGQASAEQGKGFPTPPGLAHLLERDGRLWLSESGARDDFAPDLGAKGAKHVFDAQRPIAASAFAEPVTRAAWRVKPSWYVVSRMDRMIAPQLQTATARRIGAQLQSVGSSHALPLARPTEVAYAILEAAGVKQDEPDPHEGG